MSHSAKGPSFVKNIMSDIKMRSFDDDNGERGKRGKRGHRGEQGVAGASIAFTPARTLFVAESWPAGADPTIFFTSIAAAYVASAALNPTAAEPVEILVYPGTYPDPITIVSNVHLIGTGQQRAVNVTGPVTWTPGAGINAPQTNSEEDLNVCFITSAPWLIDSTAKVSGSSGPVFRGVILSGLVYNGQVALDSAIIFASVLMPGTYTFNNIGAMNFYAVRGRVISFTGGTSAQIAGGVELGLITLSGTALARVTGIADLGGVAVGAGCSLVLAGCNNTAPITVAAGGTADVRGSNYGGNANLVGPGTINRTTFASSFGPTAIGANAVVFAVPYPDGTYDVNLQLTAGAGSAAVTVTAKTGTGFTITDPVGGNTFDFVVSHD